MKPTQPAASLQLKSKVYLSLDKLGRHPGGHTPHPTPISSHDIPDPCNIKPRDTSCLMSDILMVP